VALNYLAITHFSMENGGGNHELGTGFSVHKIIISSVKMVDFASDTVSCTILRVRWKDIISFTLPGSRQDKTDDMNVSIFEKLELVFDKFPKYHMKILLGDFIAKVGRKIFSNQQLETRDYAKL
jgi:hypothetical protein